MAGNLTITVNGRVCHPNYSGDISFTTSRGSDERYYRTVLDSDLVFTDGSGDYSWICSKPFDTEFKVVITDGSDFVWKGVFYKTDCTFNADDRQVSVKPVTDDLYKIILDRLDDTYDVVKLAPRATALNLMKRAVLQVYIVNNGNVGDKIVTNWCGNMVWEEDADTSTERSESQLVSYLTNTCSFTKLPGIATVVIRGIDELESLTGMDGLYSSATRVGTGTGSWRFNGPNDNYVIIEHHKDSVSATWCYTRMTLYKADGTQVMTNDVTDYSSTVYPYPSMNNYGSYATYDSYVRWLHDKPGVSGSVPKRTDGDLTAYNLNYRYVKPAEGVYADVEFYAATSDDPTEYGMDEYGKYFEYPDREHSQSTPYFPIAKSTWSPLSVWLQTAVSTIDQADAMSVPFTIRDTYSLPEIIKALLGEIGDNRITHDGTTDYSTWLYSSSPMRMPFLAPTSNVKKTYYTNPAQKGELSLRQVLDMLRDCFNVYWMIDGNGRFRLEHISWFMNGSMGRSDTTDLTSMKAPRNLNDWSFGQNRWSYDKVKLPERIELSYSEQQTSPFTGCVLKYTSNYVQKGEVDKIDVSGFCADVDYIIEHPSGVSDDSWVLMVPNLSEGEYTVPIGKFTYERRYIAVQNAKLAWINLFYDSLRYNMSCPDIVIDTRIYHSGDALGALSLARVRKQTVVYPSSGMPDPYALVKTGLSTEGNDGEVSSMTYYPLSGTIEATLYFNTEN